MTYIFVGIDVSKAKLDCAITLDGNAILAQAVFLNSQNGFIDLAFWIDSIFPDQEPQVSLCMESTSIYCNHLANFFSAKNGYSVSIVNPASIRAFGKTLLLRTKTDKADASLIARYCAKLNPPPRAQETKYVQKLRRLSRFLESLKQQKAHLLTQLETAIEKDIALTLRRLVKLLENEIIKIETKIIQTCHAEKKLQDQVSLLQTIPGISLTTATVLICELLPENNSRLSRKAQSAHAGLAPMERQSGTSVRGASRICKTGNARLRKSLYMPAMNAVRFNPVVKDLYQRLVAKGKPKKLALAAAMRKLLCLAIGVLNNQKPWDPNWVSLPPFALNMP